MTSDRPADDCSYRLAPGWEVVRCELLSPDELAEHPSLFQDRTVFGVLRRVGGGGPVEAVGRELALLLLSLGQPGPLPRWSDQLSPGEVRRLILDGIVEVDRGDGFLSGAAAWSDDGVESIVSGDGRLSELSLRAIRRAAQLATPRPAEIVDFLYGYNGLPGTPSRRRRLADATSLRSYSGVAALPRDLEPRPAGSATDEAVGAPDGNAPWLAWRSSRKAQPDGGPAAATYKLYISPQPDAVATALPKVLATCLPAGARQVKLGATLPGLLRPDKMVAYFDDLETLTVVAHRLAEELDGLAAHGVPFTAAVTADGLLSWGLDPDASVRRRLGLQAESWRVWLIQRLARALALAAGRLADDPPAWRFALARLSADGVDLRSWAPTGQAGFSS